MSDVGGWGEWKREANPLTDPADNAAESSPTGAPPSDNAPKDPPLAEPGFNPRAAPTSVPGAVVTDAPRAGLGYVQTEMKSTESDQARRRRWWLIGALALALAAVIVVLVILISAKSGPKYSVLYRSVQPVGGNTARIILTVRNAGGTTGTPTCTIHASAPGHAGSGTGTFIENRPLKSGELTFYINTLAISNGAADQLKSSDLSISCHTAARKAP
jgi:hypothetical protein